MKKIHPRLSLLEYLAGGFLLVGGLVLFQGKSGYMFTMSPKLMIIFSLLGLGLVAARIFYFKKISIASLLFGIISAIFSLVLLVVLFIVELLIHPPSEE